MKAIRRPSGDQAGPLSLAPEEWVRLRVGPCSAGTVKMSPRAEKAARFAFGLSEKPDTWFAAETRPGRRASWSVGTWMGTGRAAPEARSKISSEPAFS